MTRTFTSRIAAVALAATLALAGCSSTPAREDRPTITPAQPAVAPEPAVPPAGQVTPAGAGQGLAFDAKNRRLAAVTDGAVVVFSVDGGLKEIARVRTEGHANQVAAYGAGGGFLVATNNAVLVVGDDPAAEPRRIEVDGDVLSVAAYTGSGPDVLAGLADGRILGLHTSPPPNPDTITGPVEASTLLVHDGAVAVVDRLQASITEVDVAGGKAGKGLRVGRGVTNATIDPYGRIFAVDTGRNQVIGYTITPFMERFLYPVPDSPWAVTYDETAKLMWVTKTATNQVVGYALGSGMPEQRKQFPTVRQPNAVAVDAQTGTVYVQSATGGGIQAIPAT
ncbi:hypothetical protein [Tsukamurella sp. PLM1]|uniref:hypothetical protein n=1 Tax=Tsukamurella sp. PLM1 TaxID=2929795 RepID=UPI002052364C|nr:hypothetical protein [Tsukamurella sp. PLM1]BDH57474.1 putative conserved lipoprotein LppL [Tsukamurella sp. PLM1]